MKASTITSRRAPSQTRSLLTRWALLTSIVFAGSAWYGASVAHALGIGYSRGGLWLIASTGLSWCIFGPLLIAVTRRTVAQCVDACLINMTAGIGILAVGGIVNLSMTGAHGFDAVTFNQGWVGLSNIVMAAVIVHRFSLLNVAWYRTLAVWVLGLDGAGALMFWLFRHLIGVR